MQLKKLIEKAASIAGSQTALANQLGIPPQHVSNWKAGTRTCTAEDRAILADMAGEDPIAEVIEALLESVEGKPKAERLRQVLRGRIEGVRNF